MLLTNAYSMSAVTCFHIFALHFSYFFLIFFVILLKFLYCLYCVYKRRDSNNNSGQFYGIQGLNCNTFFPPFYISVLFMCC